jgi:hypothetical protein
MDVKQEDESFVSVFDGAGGARKPKAGALVFLPLGCLTGLLGINVGGQPGVETPWASAAVCAILAVLAGLAGLEVLLLRHLKWI